MSASSSSDDDDEESYWSSSEDEATYERQLDLLRRNEPSNKKLFIRPEFIDDEDVAAWALALRQNDYIRDISFSRMDVEVDDRVVAMEAWFHLIRELETREILESIHFIFCRGNRAWGPLLREIIRAIQRRRANNSELFWRPCPAVD